MAWVLVAWWLLNAMVVYGQVSSGAGASPGAGTSAAPTASQAPSGIRGDNPVQIAPVIPGQGSNLPPQAPVNQNPVTIPPPLPTSSPVTDPGSVPSAPVAGTANAPGSGVNSSSAVPSGQVSVSSSPSFAGQSSTAAIPGNSYMYSSTAAANRPAVSTGPAYGAIGVYGPGYQGMPYTDVPVPPSNGTLDINSFVSATASRLDKLDTQVQDLLRRIDDVAPDLRAETERSLRSITARSGDVRRLLPTVTSGQDSIGTRDMINRTLGRLEDEMVRLQARFNRRPTR